MMFLFFSWLATLTPSLPVEILGHDQGLGSSVVHCLFQDGQGFLWVGTQKGLYRYDGYRFKGFFLEPGNTQSLPDNDIRDMVEYRDRLWIATEAGGLCTLDLKTLTLNRIPIKPELGSVKLFDLVLKGDQLWIASDRGVLLTNLAQPLANQDISQVTPPGFFYRLAAYDDYVFAGGYGTLAMVHAKDLKASFLEMGSERNLITGIRRTSNGSLLALGFEGMFEINPATRQVTALPTLPQSAQAPITSHVSTETSLWLGTKSGLQQLEAESLVPQPVRLLGEVDLDRTYIVCTFLDSSGLLWVGTAGKGLVKINTRPKQFFHLSQAHGLQGDLVFDIVPSEESSFWVRTYDGGLDVVQPDGTILPLQHAAKTWVTLTNNDAGRAFACDSENHLWQLEFSNGVPRAAPLMQLDFRVQTLAFDEFRNALLIGRYEGGLDDFVLGSSSPKAMEIPKAMADQQVRVIYHARNGWLWIGTSNGIFFKTDANTWQSQAFGPVTYVNAIKEDAAGTLWIGTYGQGVVGFQNGQPRFLGGNLGMDPGVYALEIDDAGLVWASTDNGIYRLDPLTETLMHFEQEDGLQHSEFNSGASTKLPNGMLVFGGIKGLSAFFPRNIAVSAFKPPLALTHASYWIDDPSQPIPLNSLQAGHPITLPGAPGNLLLEFASLDFACPRRISYSYRMVGLDDRWLPLRGKTPSVSFPYLAAGSYRFQLRGTNRDGIWAEETAEWRIQIHQPFWRSFLFQVSVVLVLVMAGGFIAQRILQTYRWRTRQTFQAAPSPTTLAPAMHHPLSRTAFFSVTNMVEWEKELATSGLFPIHSREELLQKADDLELLVIILNQYPLESDTLKDLRKVCPTLPFLFLDPTRTWSQGAIAPFQPIDLVSGPIRMEEFKGCILTHLRLLKPHATPVLGLLPEERKFLERVDLLLQSHLADDQFNVEELALQMGLSRRQLLRRLKSLTGLGPASYLKKFRLQHALHYLQQGMGNVSEVAFQVGFKCPKHFSKVFSQYFGFGPSEIRRNPSCD